MFGQKAEAWSAPKLATKNYGGKAGFQDGRAIAGVPVSSAS